MGYVKRYDPRGGGRFGDADRQAIGVALGPYAAGLFDNDVSRSRRNCLVRRSAASVYAADADV